jgi:hypothetical protein
MYDRRWCRVHYSLASGVAGSKKAQLEQRPYFMWLPPTLLWLIVPWLALAQPPKKAFKDDATEALRIRPLPDGKVAVAFEFTIVSNGKRPRHPKTLDQDDESVLIIQISGPRD